MKDFMDFIDDVLAVIGLTVTILLGVGAVVFIIIAFVAVPIERAACNDVMVQSGKSTKYDFPAGCFVKVNDRFIPLDSWKGELQK